MEQFLFLFQLTGYVYNKLMWVGLCPPKRHAKALPPVPQNVTSSGKRVVAHVMSYVKSYSSYGGPCFNMTGVLIRR